jgi:hypothetical protein
MDNKAWHIVKTNAGTFYVPAGDQVDGRHHIEFVNTLSLPMTVPPPGYVSAPVGAKHDDVLFAQYVEAFMHSPQGMEILNASVKAVMEKQDANYANSR